MCKKEIFIEDFLTDRNFIRWVKHPDEEKELYWKHWLIAHPERESELLLAKEIVLRSNFNQVTPSDEAFDEVLQRLLQAEVFGGQNAGNRAQTSRWNRHLLHTAAVLVCIAVFTGLLILFHSKPEDRTNNSLSKEWITKLNQPGVKTQIRLPDGTKVWINSESALKYPANFDSLSREVTLTGEAFFEVSKDKNRPFIVRSGELSTTALGTSFNVSAYPEDEITVVSLVSGKVVVSEIGDGAGKQTILAPGDRVMHNRNDLTMEKGTFNYDSDIGWKDGILAFDEAGIREIVVKLERWYGVDIQLIGKPNERWRINGTFKKQSLMRVLNRLSFMKDFTYTLNGKNVVFNFRKPNTN